MAYLPRGRSPVERNVTDYRQLVTYGPAAAPFWSTASQCGGWLARAAHARQIDHALHAAFTMRRPEDATGVTSLSQIGPEGQHPHDPPEHIAAYRGTPHGSHPISNQPKRCAWKA